MAQKRAKNRKNYAKIVRVGVSAYGNHNNSYPYLQF